MTRQLNRGRDRESPLHARWFQILWIGLLLATGARGAAAEPVRQSAPNPAEESYRLNEARRQDLIARQLDLNFRMTRAAGYGPRYPSAFEPWPRVPGDIWGYPLPRPIEQPVGHQSVQTGPNRWIYRPLYAADLAPVAADTQPSDPAARPAPRRPGPSDANDEAVERVVPPGGKAQGPRAF
jgi:hypothetical protein